MTTIPIYQAEIDAGLKDRIENIVLSYCLPCAKSSDEQTNGKVFDKLIKTVATNKEQIDLYYLSAILSSVGWNKNTDIFTKAEVWGARHTPEDKPFNFQHDQTDNIGHITDCRAMTIEGELIDDNLELDEVPDKFHIVVDAVIYCKFPGNKDLQERVDTIIEEIEAGEWFVSLEALATGFDYGVISPDGEEFVISRNEETAFLTKHLLSYGGTGEYKGYKLGRYLKNIVFAGKGLVKKPANPESIILASKVCDSFTAKAFVTNATEIFGENTKMDEVKKLEAEKAVLTSDFEKAKAQIQELITTNAGLSKELETAKAEGVASVKALETVVAELKAKIEERDVSIETLKASVQESNDKLEAVRASERSRERIQKLEKVGKTAEEAATLEKEFSALADEMFDKVIAHMTPTKVETPKVEVEVEDDPAEVTAVAAELDAVKATEEPALTTEVDSEISVLSELTEYFSKKIK